MARSSRHLARPSPCSRRSPSPRTAAALASDDPAPPSPQPQPRTVGRAGGRAHSPAGGSRAEDGSHTRAGVPAVPVRVGSALPPEQQSERNPTLTQKPSTSPLWDHNYPPASPSSFRDLGKGGTLLKAEPNLGCRPALRMNQAPPSLQPPTHSCSPLEGPRMEEKTKQDLGNSRAKNVRNFLGNAVPYGFH